MLDVLQGFVHELRLAGLPVSMTENLDAMRAVEHVPLDDREAFKTALGATLVKHHGHHAKKDSKTTVAKGGATDEKAKTGAKTGGGKKGDDVVDKLLASFK